MRVRCRVEPLDYLGDVCLRAMSAAGMIMEAFVPTIGKLWRSLAFGVLITTINLFYMKAFGEVEFWLSLVKIAAILLFSALAYVILVGAAGAGREAVSMPVRRRPVRVEVRGGGPAMLQKTTGR